VRFDVAEILLVSRSRKANAALQILDPEMSTLNALCHFLKRLKIDVGFPPKV
jgi:hypothetical protein